MTYPVNWQPREVPVALQEAQAAAAQEARAAGVAHLLPVRLQAT